MVTERIQYHDLDGDLREDNFYFLMNQTQYARVNAMFPGGLQEYAMKAAKDKNSDNMFHLIDTLVREAYGERVGNDFVKVAPNGQKLADFFINTEAYDNLLIKLMNSEDNLLSFMTGCLNKDAQDRVNAEIKRAKEDGTLNIPGTIGAAEKPSLTVVDKK